MTSGDDGGGQPRAPFDDRTTAPLRLDIQVRELGQCRVAVSGEIDFSTHRELLDTLLDLVERGHHRVVLDLRRVTFCDSTGLGVFVQVRQRADAAGGWLRVAALTDPVRRALEITNLDRLIPAFPTVTEAEAG